MLSSFYSCVEMNEAHTNGYPGITRYNEPCRESGVAGDNYAGLFRVTTESLMVCRNGCRMPSGMPGSGEGPDL